MTTAGVNHLGIYRLSSFVLGLWSLVFVPLRLCRNTKDQSLKTKDRLETSLIRHQRLERPECERDEDHVEACEQRQPEPDNACVWLWLEKRRRSANTGNDDRNSNRIQQHRQEHVSAP